MDWFRERSRENGDGYATFLGAGAYSHYRPVIIDSLISRGEFLTAYTPYQAEISQGTLQSIFEFQTMICELTGMEVANASMYDGSTAATEAAMMAVRAHRSPLGGRGAQGASGVSRSACDLRTQSGDAGCRWLGFARRRPASIWRHWRRTITADTACVLIQSPNFFGTIEDVAAIAEIAHKHGALLVVSIAEAVSLGIVEPPRRGGHHRYGSAIVWRAAGFGGPYCGVIATREKFVRQMPGRLVGQTTDTQRQARICADAVHARAAHPPREGDLEHLHQPGADRADGEYLHDGLRQGWIARAGEAKSGEGCTTRSASSAKHGECAIHGSAALQRIRGAD